MSEASIADTPTISSDTPRPIQPEISEPVELETESPEPKKTHSMLDETETTDLKTADSSELLSGLEAILFVAETPVPLAELSSILELSDSETEKALAMLSDRLERDGSGLEVRSVGGGWRLYTRPELEQLLHKFSQTPTARRLSPAALETLAIVAYRQPVTRSKVAEIRGVDSDSVLSNLERLGLVEISGHLGGPGQAVLYRTTTLFLESLGLMALSELPPLADHVPGSEVMDSLEETFRNPE